MNSEISGNRNYPENVNCYSLYPLRGTSSRSSMCVICWSGVDEKVWLFMRTKVWDYQWCSLICRFSVCYLMLKCLGESVGICCEF